MAEDPQNYRAPVGLSPAAWFAEQQALAAKLVLAQDMRLPGSVPAQSDVLSSNCYAYALNHFVLGGLMPGHVAKMVHRGGDPEGDLDSAAGVRALLAADGLEELNPMSLFTSASWDSLMSAFLEREAANPDFHFRRLDAGGGVSQKLGGGDAELNRVEVLRAGIGVAGTEDAGAVVELLSEHRNTRRPGATYDFVGFFLVPLSLRQRLVHTRRADDPW